MEENNASPLDLLATIAWAVLAMSLTLPYVAQQLGVVAAIGAGILFPLTAPILPLAMFIFHGYVLTPVILYGSALLILWARKYWGSWM